jgi:hydroxylamine reductase (hybrid-cluster protein)
MPFVWHFNCITCSTKMIPYQHRVTTRDISFLEICSHLMGNSFLRQIMWEVVKQLYGTSGESPDFTSIQQLLKHRSSVYL